MTEQKSKVLSAGWGNTGAQEFSQKRFGHVSLCVLSGIRVLNSGEFTAFVGGRTSLA
jgi:hypothetical protein